MCNWILQLLQVSVILIDLEVMLDFVCIPMVLGPNNHTSAVLPSCAYRVVDISPNLDKCMTGCLQIHCRHHHQSVLCIGLILKTEYCCLKPSLTCSCSDVQNLVVSHVETQVQTHRTFCTLMMLAHFHSRICKTICHDQAIHYFLSVTVVLSHSGFQLRSRPGVFWTP